MIDVRSIIAAGDRYNLHSHTEYCDGRVPMDSIIDAAVSHGFTTWGFSPHSPLPIESPCNMSAADVAVYLDRIDVLRRQYPDITILAGMEADYLDDNNGPGDDKTRDYGLDYVIGSVHFVPGRNGVPYDIDGSSERFQERLKTVFGGDLDYVVRTFWQQTMRMIHAGGFDIIGHIDKIAMNAAAVRPRLEVEPEYRSMAAAAVDAAIKAGVAIEINTKQRLTKRRFFPHPRHWARIARSGVPMPINSDAHTVEGVDSYRSDARRLLRAIVALDTTPGAKFAVITDSDSMLTVPDDNMADLSCLVTRQPGVLRDATIVARAIDKDVAVSMISGGVHQIFAIVISEAALDLFEPHTDIFVDFDVIAPQIP